MVVVEAAGRSCQFNQPNMDSGGMCRGSGSVSGVYTWESADFLPPSHYPLSCRKIIILFFNTMRDDLNSGSFISASHISDEYLFVGEGQYNEEL